MATWKRIITATDTIAVGYGGTGAQDVSTARDNLGVEIGVDVQAYDADLAAFAGLTPSDGGFIVGTGTSAGNWTVESGATARASLGLTIASAGVQNGLSTIPTVNDVYDFVVVQGYSTATGVENNADVTDTANVTSAGALMDSEVDADIKTLTIAASSSISGSNTGDNTVCTSGAATTFTSTSQNSQFNSIGVGTAGSGTAGEIRATDEVTAYYSDDRLKTKSGNIENALDKVVSLNGFHYQPNELAGELGYDTSAKKVGVSAQEVLKVLPEAVVPAPIDPKYHTVQYDKLIPLLIESIKELTAKVTRLENGDS